MSTTSGVVSGEKRYKGSWKGKERGGADGRTDRRKQGVNKEKRGC
jgi:hypothetical protein